MSGSIGSLLLIIIAVASGIYWFILKRQNDEEDNDRIEPHIDHRFSEFSQQALPKDEGDDDTVTESVQTAVVEATEVAAEPAPKAAAHSAPVEPKVEHAEKRAAERLPEDSEDLEDELEEDDEHVEDHAPKVSFFTRIKEMFAGSSNTEDDHNDEAQLARPEAVRTVALILRAPDDQPYSGYEVLETAKQLKLMVGTDGFLQQIVTTYLGDEPMYSIANMIHPGSFDTPDILEAEIPGLLFFASIPGPDPQMDTVENLIRAAAFFGQSIGGTLLDEHQRPVDAEYVQNLVAQARAEEKKIWAKHRSHR